MSDTSRREFISGVTKLAGVSAAATIAGGAPGVALGAVREHAGKSAITTPANAIVETSAGKVRGYVRNGIFTFKGIPYAGTTAGEARFLPPAPVTPWTQVRASMSYGPVCPQPVRGGWASDRLAFLFDWDDGLSGRRLSATQRVDAGRRRSQQAARHGLAARRRLRSRLVAGAAVVRRRESEPSWRRRRRQRQSSAQRLRLPEHGSGRRREVRALGQRRHARHRGRAAVGARQRRPFRRRSCERDGLRSVRRRLRK